MSKINCVEIEHIPPRSPGDDRMPYAVGAQFTTGELAALAVNGLLPGVVVRINNPHPNATLDAGVYIWYAGLLHEADRADVEPTRYSVWHIRAPKTVWLVRAGRKWRAVDCRPCPRWEEI